VGGGSNRYRRHSGNGRGVNQAMNSLPGIFVLRDDDPAYLDAVAAAIRDPAVSVVRTHQIGGGVREVTFEVGGERRLNPPTVDPWTIPRTRKLLTPREYFRSPLKTYSEWKEAWWREAIQNSVDAGATEIHCDVSEEDDSYRISCRDNGGGMSPEILMNVFMALAGTTKEGAEGETSMTPSSTPETALRTKASRMPPASSLTGSPLT